MTKDETNIKEKISIKDDKSKKVKVYGFLQKRSKYIHLWKTRFFILTNNYLFAFTGIENDADCTMAMNLKGVLEVVEIPNENKVKKEFEIKTINGNFFFRAESEEVMKRWLNELNAILEKNKPHPE